MKHLIEIKLIIEDGITHSEMLQQATDKLDKACEASGLKFGQSECESMSVSDFEQKVKEVKLQAYKDAEKILINS